VKRDRKKREEDGEKTRNLLESGTKHFTESVRGACDKEICERQKRERLFSLQIARVRGASIRPTFLKKIKI
jgi:hypothetical protein